MTAQPRALRREEKRSVALLGLPTLALALVATVVTTYTPVVSREFVGSTLVIGLIIGLEGVVALWLPLLAGAWSDRLQTRLGGRLPFLLAASPVVALALAGLAVAGSTVVLAAAALVFFTGYFVAYEPYRALYPDAVGDEIAGRAQATQAVWRGAGTGLALVGGGLLLAFGRGTPFLTGAAIFIVCVAVFTIVLVHRGIPRSEGADEGGARQAFSAVRRLVGREPALKAFLVANGLWELTLAALKTFVVLYVTAGLGFSRTTAALIIGGVAVLVLLASLAAGKLADRFGAIRVLTLALPVYGVGFLVPFFFSSHLIIALAMPFIALGGGVIMALPYAVLMPLMPDSERGVMTGYYSFSRGLGTWLGPLLAGGAITALDGVFTATEGYQAVWGVCAAAALASMIPLRRLAAATR